MELQLADKTQSAKQHVEELTRMRADMAKERLSLTTLGQEIRNTATGELEKVRKIELLRRKSLKDQFERLQAEKCNLKKEVDSTKSLLQGKQNILYIPYSVQFVIRP